MCKPWAYRPPQLNCAHRLAEHIAKALCSQAYSNSLLYSVKSCVGVVWLLLWLSLQTELFQEDQ